MNGMVTGVLLENLAAFEMPVSVSRLWVYPQVPLRLNSTDQAYTMRGLLPMQATGATIEEVHTGVPPAVLHQLLECVEALTYMNAPNSVVWLACLSSISSSCMRQSL
jgi:hypothetical protein